MILLVTTNGKRFLNQGGSRFISVTLAVNSVYYESFIYER